MSSLLSTPVKPDYEAFLSALRRQGTPKRIHGIELFHDGEVANAITERFGIGKDLDRNDPHYMQKHHTEWMRFMGYDYVSVGIGGGGMAVNMVGAPDSTKTLTREKGRAWVDESNGRIANWDDFEKYPWPDFTKHDTSTIEWYHENLPDDMTIIGPGPCGNWCEFLCWLFGLQTLCLAIYEQPDLVQAVRDKIEEMLVEKTKAYLQFPRVSAVWGADDLGFKTGLLLGVPATREIVLPGHKQIVKMVHGAGRLYLMHCCGNLYDIYDDLIDDVQIDAKHSFEDTIEDVRDVKRRYGSRLSLLGGIDVDFLCRSDEAAIRKRVRDTAEVCMPGGGWLLGTGNSVANYIPLENYLAMVDEGRKIRG